MLSLKVKEQARAQHARSSQNLFLFYPAGKCVESGEKLEYRDGGEETRTGVQILDSRSKAPREADRRREMFERSVIRWFHRKDSAGGSSYLKLTGAGVGCRDCVDDVESNSEIHVEYTARVRDDCVISRAR
ncbi:hypothetical protein Tco_0539986 [Tanacetum coccineum]